MIFQKLWNCDPEIRTVNGPEIMDVDDGCSKFVGGKFGDDFDPRATNITITNISGPKIDPNLACSYRENVM